MSHITNSTDPAPRKKINVQPETTLDSPWEDQRKFGHELANVFTTIVAISELLLLRACDSSDTEVIRLATDLRRVTTNAGRLLHRVNEIQELESGKRKLTLRRGNLVTVLNNAIHRLIYDSEEIDCINLSCNVDDALVEMDHSLLPAGFCEIIQNAVDHTTSNLLPDQRTVHISLRSTDANYVTEVSNSGPPISSDRLATFFEKFNTDRTRKNNIGTGLGTTLARLIFQAHRGHICVVSDDIQGTVVTISIPKAVPQT